MQKMGPAMSEVVEMLTGAARQILDRWFESEELKGTLATDAIIGAFAAPSMPGTAYVLFHHVMGETNGKKGVWAYMRGGMGGLTQSIARAASISASRSAPKPKLPRFSPRTAASTGVALASGEEFARKARRQRRRHAPSPSNAFSIRSRCRRISCRRFGRISYDSASVKINVALDRLPSFTALPGHDPGPQHHGTVHLCPDQDFIERAYDDAKYGAPSREPVVECTLPSSLDETLAPPGKHLMSMFVQYAPYTLRSGPWTNAIKDDFADRCFAIVERYAPGLARA